MVQPIGKPGKVVEVVEYRVVLSGRHGAGTGSRAITVTFEGIDARRNLSGATGQGEAKAEDTVREAVEHMLPPPWGVVRVSRTVANRLAAVAEQHGDVELTVNKNA